MKTKDFLRRRWYDFRLGHTTYLVFIISFSNFILIFYNLYLEKFGIKISLPQFILLFIFVYIPLATGIGALHRKKQLKIDQTQAWTQNPLFMKMYHDIEEIKNCMKKPEKTQTHTIPNNPRNTETRKENNEQY